MIKIKVRPSCIALYPYTKGMIPQIEKGLGVWDNVAYKYSHFLYDFDPEPNEKYGVLKIPKGFGLETLIDIVNTEGYEYQVINECSLIPDAKTVSFEMKLKPRNEIQEESIDFLNKTFHPGRMQAFVNLDVGYGKTFCTVRHVHDKQMATLIVSFNLSNQWVERISDYTNLETGSQIVPVIGTQYFKDLIDKKIKPNGGVFYITTTNTLTKMVEMYGKESLQQIADILRIGIKVFDEAHTRYLMFNTIDLNMQTQETIYLTATPGRSDRIEDRMYAKIYKDVPSFGGFTTKLTNHYIIKYITIDSRSTAKERLKFKTVRGLSSMIYTKWLFDKWGENLVHMIMDYCEPILKEDDTGKLLIVTDQLVDIAYMKDKLNQEYPEYSVGQYCMIIKNRQEKEEQLNKRIILGTIGSMQNGKDIEHLRAIFCISCFSSKIVAHQLLGRLRPIKGKFVYYFDIADSSVYSTILQRKEKDRIFQERAQNEITTDVVDIERF